MPEHHPGPTSKRFCQDFSLASNCRVRMSLQGSKFRPQRIAPEAIQAELETPVPPNPTQPSSTPPPVRSENGRSSAVGEESGRCIICTRDIDSKSPSAPPRRCSTRTTDGHGGDRRQGRNVSNFFPIKQPPSARPSIRRVGWEYWHLASILSYCLSPIKREMGYLRWEE